MEFGGDVKIEADRDTCTAAGQCASVAAALFDQDEDGVVVLLKAEPSEAEEALARRAASLCPARAITIIEE
jgi:ferredoxin